MITEICCGLSTTKISLSQTTKKYNITLEAQAMLVCMKNTTLQWVSQESYSTWLVLCAV